MAKSFEKILAEIRDTVAEAVRDSLSSLDDDINSAVTEAVTSAVGDAADTAASAAEDAIDSNSWDFDPEQLEADAREAATSELLADLKDNPARFLRDNYSPEGRAYVFERLAKDEEFEAAVSLGSAGPQEAVVREKLLNELKNDPAEFIVKYLDGPERFNLVRQMTTLAYHEDYAPLGRQLDEVAARKAREQMAARLLEMLAA